MIDAGVVDGVGRTDAAAGTAPANVTGRVEAADLREGVFGWAYDVANLSRPLLIELWAGRLLVAVTPADRYRGDLGSERLPDFNPGFFFSATTLRCAALNLAVEANARLSIRVAGSDVSLPGFELDDIADLREAIEDLGAPVVSAAGLDLRSALHDLIGHARLIRRQPLRALSEGAVGVIERLAPAGRDKLAISGWFRRDVALEQAAVILCGDKFDAAFSLVTYERGDLPDYAIAFIGVLQTAWRPAPAGSDFLLFFGPHGDFHLRSTAALRLEGVGEMEAAFGRAAAASGASRVVEMRQLLLSDHGWQPRGDGGSALGVTVSVDRVVLIPGFGAFVDGWVLAGPRKVAAMTLRIGTAVLECDPATMQVIARPDLAGVPGARPAAMASAGFCATFIGRLQAEDRIDPILKISFDDGVVLAVPLSPSLPEQCNAGFDMGSLAVLRSGLPFEPRLPDFARARSKVIRREIMASVQSVMPARGRHVIVMALPPRASDAALVLESARRAFAFFPKGYVLAIVGQPSHSRERIMRWVSRLAADGRADGAAVSLTLVADTDYAVHALGHLGTLHDADRIAFVGSHVWLTRDGWSRLIAGMEASDPAAPEPAEPVFLPVADFAEPVSRATRDDELFLWSAEALARWCEDAPVSFNEAARDRGLPGSDPDRSGAVAGVRMTSGRNGFKHLLDRMAHPASVR